MNQKTINQSPRWTKISKIILILVLFYLVPIHTQGEDVKECDAKVLCGWASGPVTYMVNECFQAMNRASLKNWGAPIQPFLGMNQCSCVTDKIRKKYPCQEDYNKFATKSPGSSALLIQKMSVQCIKDGAMGEEARRAYLDGVRELEKEESEKDTPIIKQPSTEEEAKEEAAPLEQPTWKELSNQG